MQGVDREERERVLGRLDIVGWDAGVGIVKDVDAGGGEITSATTRIAGVRD